MVFVDGKYKHINGKIWEPNKEVCEYERKVDKLCCNHFNNSNVCLGSKDGWCFNGLIYRTMELRIIEDNKTGELF